MKTFKVLIKDGKIIDGMGREPHVADIGISGKLIECIGDLSTTDATQVIDAHNLIVSPGFIDVHSHSDLRLFLHPREKLFQGVTSEIIGNCGLSVYPCPKERKEEIQGYIQSFFGSTKVHWEWTDANSYFHKLQEQELTTNIGSLVGHSILRIISMGFKSGKPNKNQMDTMKMHLEKALEQGALGLSTGLEYAPGSYSSTNELVELCKVLKDFPGTFYATHLRDQFEGLLDSVKEAISIGKQTGVPIHISHHQAPGPANFGRTQKTLSLIKKAINEGQNITLDMYPYTASSTAITYMLPQYLLENGIRDLIHRVSVDRERDRIIEIVENNKKLDWNNIMLNSVSTEKNQKFVGKTLQKIANMRGASPVTSLLDLIMEEKGKASIIRFDKNEEDVNRVLKFPHTSLGTDGLFPGEGSLPHPRLYGSFPRFIGKIVRDGKLMALQEGIRKCTSLPASTLGQNSIGKIEEGAQADIVIFDYNTIIDKGTFFAPYRKPKGIHHVLVAGVPVIKSGKFTGETPGKVLT